MKKKEAIHNLDSLEREIYRLKLEARIKEAKLTDNWEQLIRDFPEILTNSLFCRQKKSENGRETFTEKIFNNEKRGSFLDRILEKLTDRIADRLDVLFEKVFHKNR